jgi:hypothetical protein
MTYRCPLPAHLAKVAAGFSEFANGGAQATVRLKDGRQFEKALISGSVAVIALRGFKEPPFHTEEIAEVFQSEEDKHTVERSGWEFWDKWE